MQKAKVSVIVPIYNSQDYLPACIESIINQTYKNLEILLIDDGSKDESLEICNRYGAIDERIKVIHQENRGVSAARNNGLDNMTGDYFAFVDSDDTLADNAMEFLLQDILLYHADMASAVKSTVGADGSIANIYEDHSLNVYSDLDMLKLSLDGERQTNSACAKLFKVETFGHIRFTEGKNINEDGFFLFQCYLLKPKVIQHNESIYYYFIRQASNSRSTFSEKYFDMLYFCDRKKEIINSDFPELANKLVTMEVSAHLFFLEILCRTNEKKYKKAQKDSVRLVKRYYSIFDCMNKHERQMAWIVAHGLYPLYKWAVRMKYYR